MKRVILLVGILGNAMLTHYAEGQTLALDMGYDGSMVFSGAQPMLDEKTKLQVLRALCLPERDELLAKILPSRLVGTDMWYDLRGIEVRNGELIGRSANLSRICWDGARFEEADLSGADLNGAMLRAVTFDRVNLDNAIFDNAKIEGAVFIYCRVSSASIRRASFSPTTKFLQCILDGARFDTSPNMKGVEFNGGSLKATVFRQSKLQQAKFVDTDITDADFDSADLTEAQFYNTIINGVDFTDAILARSKLDRAKLSTNLRLIRTTLSATALGDIDLSKVDMTYVVWRDRDYRVGEEIEADHLLSRDRGRGTVLHAAELYAKAENIYRVLAQRYKVAGYLQEYSGLRVRSLEARRKLLLLDGGGVVVLEAGWLGISRFVDNYDTSLGRYLYNLSRTIAVFATIFFIALRMKAQWFVWYVTQPDGKEYLCGQDGRFVEAFPSIADALASATFRGRIRKNVRLWLVGLELSLEALFRFVENIIDIPNLVHLFIKNHEVRPLPKAWGARVIHGIEAWCGIIFLFFGSRMLLLTVGSQ